MSLEQKLDTARRQQTKGKLIEETDGEDIPREPTLYEKSTELVTSKLFSPTSQTDQELLSKIPRQILVNINAMQYIEHGLRAMITGKQILIDPDKNSVIIYTDDQKTIVKKRMTYKAYRRAVMYADFMNGVTGHLLQELPAIDGNRADQGVTVIGSLMASEHALIQAQNANNAGFLKKIWRKIV